MVQDSSPGPANLTQSSIYGGNLAIIGTNAGPTYSATAMRPFRPIPGVNGQNCLPELSGPGSSGDPQDSSSISPFGNRLAQSCLQFAAGNKNLGRRRCYHFVKKSMASEGINLRGDKAYQAASQLAKHPGFKEVKIPRGELTELPAGAVVVWNRNQRHNAGHISVALGDGREVSDRIRPQSRNYKSQYRVFVPQEAPATMLARGNPRGNPRTSVI